MYLISTFNQDLQINFAEFSNYGNAFSFSWAPLNISRVSTSTFKQSTKSSKVISSKSNIKVIEEKTIETESVETIEITNKYGMVKAESTSLVGFIEFDSRVLCEPNCYVGISPRTHNSIIDQSSLYITDLDNLDNYEQPLLYDMWIRSFHPAQLDPFDLDSKMLAFYFRKWRDLNAKSELFTSSLRFDMANNLSFAYPIDFKFDWPRLLIKSQQKAIHFSSTQVNMGKRLKNVTLHNPSNVTLLTQIMMLDAYPQRENLIKLLKNISATYGPLLDDIFKDEAGMGTWKYF